MKFWQRLLAYSLVGISFVGCHRAAVSEASLSSTQELSFTQPRTKDNFPQYVAMLKRYARQQQIKESTIQQAFRDVHYIQRVVAADKNQPENKQTLNQYLARAVSDSRKAAAKEKYQQYYPQMQPISARSGVSARFITALWGVESGYGRYQGKEDVISALATLAFDGRRESFFQKELLSALTILEQGHIGQKEFKGSWAGAMGQCQFMPSSLLSYGADGDGDGRIDIWNNQKDVFASIANYLSTVGWKTEGEWGNKIALPQNFDPQLAGLDNQQAKTVAQWQQLGIRNQDHKALPAAGTRAWVVIPDDELSNAYLVYDNFRTLMHWNRSYYFAISVGQLADSLRNVPVKG